MRCLRVTDYGVSPGFPPVRVNGVWGVSIGRGPGAGFIPFSDEHQEVLNKLPTDVRPPRFSLFALEADPYRLVRDPKPQNGKSLILVDVHVENGDVLQYLNVGEEVDPQYAEERVPDGVLMLATGAGCALMQVQEGAAWMLRRQKAATWKELVLHMQDGYLNVPFKNP